MGNKRNAADASHWDQDGLFTVMTAARIVPAAASSTPHLASSVCGRLPIKAASLAELKAALNLPPDLENIVLEIAALRPAGCSKQGIDAAALLFEQAKIWVKEAQVNAKMASDTGEERHKVAKGPPLLQHDRRSVVFILASVDSSDIAKWLAEEVGMHGGAWALGLRVRDRIALLDRLARQSMTGFQAVQHALTTSAARLNATKSGTSEHPQDAFGAKEKEEVEVLQGSLTLGVPAAAGELPGWAELEYLLGSALIKQARGLLQTEKEAATHLFPVLTVR
jgi:hypothetical protein